MSTSKTLDPYVQIPFQKGERWTFSTTAPFTPTYVMSNLSLSSDPAGMYNTRVKGRQVLLENPIRESRAKKKLDEERATQRKEREKKSGVLSKKMAKEMGLWKLDEAQAKYNLFLPLHQMWMGYMSELLGLLPRPSQPVSTSVAAKAMPKSTGMHPKLVKADFHGSIMTVVQSKNPCLVGISGIVIHETENTFKVVTKEDKVKVLPKQNSVFMFAVPLYSTCSQPSESSSTTLFSSSGILSTQQNAIQTVLDSENIQFQLYGNQFRFRSAERAGRKFKHKETIEL